MKLREKMKSGFAKVKAKCKKWWLALLIALGIISGAIAVPVDFSWDNPTQYEDGTTYDPAVDQAETRLYCGVDPNTFVPGTDTNPQTLTPNTIVEGDATTGFVDLIPGTRLCFATVVDIHGMESMPSNVVTREVVRFKPEPPVLR